ncbi:MAG TPA: dolichyl-phosphate beta-glucosyltransferase [Chthoniobacterales bacterium]|nr:dolichyl-phosphate beta-glucosyltransferase [Chthoniobacterales bacterium]
MSTQILPHLSLVIPAFNEARRLPDTLKELRDYSRRWSFPFEVIVVVELSTDDTLTLAQAGTKTFPQLKVIGNRVHRGKGFAVRTGMLASAGELVFFTDADLSTPLEEIDRALTVFDSDRDLQIIVGNRQHPDSEIIRHQSWMRERMGKTFNALVRWMAGIQIRDTQCGFKGFRHNACRAIFERQKTDGFSFDVEVLLLAKALDFRVREMPVHWSNSPDSKVRVISDSLKMLLDVAVVRQLVRRTLEEQPYNREQAVTTR